MGSILFLGNMINPSGHAISTITALNKVELIFIPYQSIIQVLSKNKEFNESVYKQSAFDLYGMHQFVEVELNDNLMLYLIDKSEYKEYVTNTMIELKNGGFLFAGKIEKEEDMKKSTFKEICFIPPSEVDYQTLSEVKILAFTVQLKENMDDDLNPSFKASFHRDSFANVLN